MRNKNVKNSNTETKDTGKYGLGLFASRNIKKGEIVADWTRGKVYEAESAMNLPSKEITDHAIQFREYKWIDTKGVARHVNHSCEPNCGIKGRFQIIAMRDIKKGEELTFDYEMTEDSDWKMKCECGSQSCRKIIGLHKNMPKLIRKKI